MGSEAGMQGGGGRDGEMKGGVGKRCITSTSDNGLPLTLIMPLPFLQWLTATCGIVTQRSFDALRARCRRNKAATERQQIIKKAHAPHSSSCQSTEQIGSLCYTCFDAWVNVCRERAG